MATSKHIWGIHYFNHAFNELCIRNTDLSYFVYSSFRQNTTCVFFSYLLFLSLDSIKHHNTFMHLYSFSLRKLIILNAITTQLWTDKALAKECNQVASFQLIEILVKNTYFSIMSNLLENKNFRRKNNEHY